MKKNVKDKISITAPKTNLNGNLKVPPYTTLSPHGMLLNPPATVDDSTWAVSAKTYLLGGLSEAGLCYKLHLVAGMA